MAENLIMPSGTKDEIYDGIIHQIKALVGEETDPIANMANIAAALKTTFEFLWVGFYLVKENELVLGPFQGPVACTRISKGKGVCGAAWEQRKTLIVPDVEEFPGHIACSSLSKSEIVIPLIKNNTVIGLLDVDSEKLAAFDDVDSEQLNKLCKWLSEKL